MSVDTNHNTARRPYGTVQAIKFVERMQELADEYFPDAGRIRVVLDNLNTQTGSLYEFFEPAEAYHLLDKLEFHFTPVYGSWLNMAEIEFNALEQQCLDRRILDAAILCQEVAAWREQNVVKRVSTGDSKLIILESN